jgi:hypothetical protein
MHVMEQLCPDVYAISPISSRSLHLGAQLNFLAVFVYLMRLMLKLLLFFALFRPYLCPYPLQLYFQIFPLILRPRPLQPDGAEHGFYMRVSVSAGTPL